MMDRSDPERGDPYQPNYKARQDYKFLQSRCADETESNHQNLSLNYRSNTAMLGRPEYNSVSIRDLLSSADLLIDNNKFVFLAGI